MRKPFVIFVFLLVAISSAFAQNQAPKWGEPGYENTPEFRQQYTQQYSPPRFNDGVQRMPITLPQSANPTRSSPQQRVDSDGYRYDAAGRLITPAWQVSSQSPVGTIYRPYYGTQPPQPLPHDHDLEMYKFGRDVATNTGAAAGVVGAFVFAPEAAVPISLLRLGQVGATAYLGSSGGTATVDWHEYKKNHPDWRVTPPPITPEQNRQYKCAVSAQGCAERK